MQETRYTAAAVRDINHIVATHTIARQRRDAGLPVWEHRISVADIWSNENLTFEQSRDAIVDRLRQSPWIADRDQAGFDELGEVVENLAAAEDFDEFNNWWGELYNRADYGRVWIATF